MKNISPFEQVYATLIEKGISVMPIMPGAKCPGYYDGKSWSPMRKWDDYTKRMPNDHELEAWAAWPDAGIGMALGQVSSIVGIDIDYDEQGSQAKIEAILPPSPCKKRGAKGYTAFYSYNGEPSRKWTSNGRSVIEILSNGRQTVMPPSRHPEEYLYQWTTPDTLENYDDELPSLPPDFIEQLDAMFNVPTSTAIDFGSGGGVWRHINDAALNRMSEWVPDIAPLDSIRSHIDGYRLKAFWRDGDGWNISIHKNGISDFARDTTYTAIDFLVKCGECVDPQAAATWLRDKLHIKEETIEMPIIPGGNLSKLTPVKELPIPDIMLNPPGIVGMLSEWINETSIRLQPMLSLGASIAAVGTLMGHRVQTQTGLRSNMLVVGTGASGCGKDHARKKIRELFDSVMAQHLGGGSRIASSAGLFQVMMDCGGIRLFLLDEMGRMLTGLTGRNSSHHQSDIPTMIMEMFSSANSIIGGTEYADPTARAKAQGKESPVAGHTESINQPCLSIYGTTVPESFYSSMQQAETLDGFLSRWLILHSKDADPEEREIDIRKSLDVPGPLKAAAEKILAMKTNVNIQGDLDDIQNIRPEIIAFNTAAFDRLKAFKVEIRAHRKDVARKDGTDALWARAAEHAQKLALIASSGGHQIDDIAMAWGIATSRYCLQSLSMDVRDRISDNAQEEKTKRFIQIIKSAGTSGIKKSELTRKSQWLTCRERDDMIKTLAESEQICQIENKSKYKPSVSYAFRFENV